MIKSISIENFGPYENRTFDFSEGLNLIRGPNRSGKTWLLRAIAAVLYNWGAFNSDDGLDEIRHEAPDGTKAPHYRIQLTFTDGAWVERYRDKSTNSYTICPAGKEPREHTAIGRGFYEPVGEVTGIRPVCLDGSDDYQPNVKLLEDPRFFLLGESSHKQDAILTRLVGVDIIEKAASDTESDRRKLLMEANRLSDEIDDVADEVSQYDIVPKLIKRLKQAATKLNEWDRLTNLATQGAEKLKKHSELADIGVSLSNRVETLSRATSAVSAILGDVKPMAERAASGRSVITRLVELTQNRDQLRKRLAVLQRIPDIKQAIDAATEVSQQAKAARDLWTTRKVNEVDLRRLANKASGYADDMGRMQEEREQLLKDAGVCPVCGQTIE